MKKYFFEIYLLGKPMGDSNSQPRGKYHGSMQLSYWATHKLVNQSKILKYERKLGREDGFAPSTSKEPSPGALLLSYSPQK
jgi:hypothetical protein